MSHLCVGALCTSSAYWAAWPGIPTFVSVPCPRPKGWEVVSLMTRWLSSTGSRHQVSAFFYFDAAVWRLLGEEKLSHGRDPGVGGLVFGCGADVRAVLLRKRRHSILVSYLPYLDSTLEVDLLLVLGPLSLTLVAVRNREHPHQVHNFCEHDNNVLGHHDSDIFCIVPCTFRWRHRFET